jgi:hypothetical protein
MTLAGALNLTWLLLEIELRELFEEVDLFLGLLLIGVFTLHYFIHAYGGAHPLGRMLCEP